MKMIPVTDPSFREYGQILTGYDVEPLLKELERVTPQSTAGTDYVPCQKEFMDLPLAKEISDNAFGGMPIEIGWCNGYNTMLNALEYHRDSELNVGTQDFVLLLARRGPLSRSMPQHCTMPPAAQRPVRGSEWRWCCRRGPTWTAPPSP